MNQIWSGFTAGLIIASAMSMQPMAAQDKKENDKKSETVIVGGTPSTPLTFAPADSTAERTVIAGGQTIPYRAIAGTLTVGSNDVQDAMLGPDGKALPSNGETLPDQATARMFYVAYFNKEAGARRPITFIYNGGPGGASLLLHMGAFGPRRVVVPDGQLDPGAPYNIINNDYTLLDVSDIVFVDAPGTGFGRIMGPGKETAFWGNDPDTHAFERFIRRFLNKYNKWNSPKYLLGESYGTLRNAMLAANLQDVRFNGLIMLSQILDFDNNADGQQFDPGPEQAYALALPTYAAIAFYHHKLQSQPAELEPFLDEVKQYALGEYMSALLQGSQLTDARKQAVAEKLHDCTGLSLAFLLKANLRVRAGVFMKTLLSDNETTTGRLDARYKGLGRTDSNRQPPSFLWLARSASPFVG